MGRGVFLGMIWLPYTFCYSFILSQSYYVIAIWFSHIISIHWLTCLHAEQQHLINHFLSLIWTVEIICSVEYLVYHQTIVTIIRGLLACKSHFVFLLGLTGRLLLHHRSLFLYSDFPTIEILRYQHLSDCLRHSEEIYRLEGCRIHSRQPPWIYPTYTHIISFILFGIRVVQLAEALLTVT